MPAVGDIGLVRITGPAGWAIQVGELLYDGAWQVSHAFTYVGENKIIEAEPGGARIVDVDEYADRTIYWLHFPDMTDAQRLGISALAKKLEGIPYNWADYVCLALWRFWPIRTIKGRRLFVSRLGDRIADPSRQMCSQLSDFLSEQVGYTLFDDGRLPGFVTPGDLWRLWKKQYNTSSRV